MNITLSPPHTTTSTMLSLKARTLFSSPFSRTFSPPKQLLPRLNLAFSIKASFQSTHSRSSTTMSTSSTPAQTIEHVVLFKVKDGADSSQINAMVNGLNDLISLDQVVHITAGPVIRTRSSQFNFTHMLHSRYNTKDDLTAYAVHPNHMRVVTESVRPICEDIMAVDWTAEHLPDPRTLPPGAAVKLTFLKLKENLGQDVKDEILGVIGGIKDEIPGIDQITCGENFSDRAKGFSIASIAVFKSLSEMEAVESKEELVKLQKDKVRDHLESVMVIDYVVPSSQSSSL